MPETEALSRLLLTLERALMSHEVRTDVERLCTLLAYDFREIGRSGRSYTRDDILAGLPQEKAPMDVKVDHFETTCLSPTIALVNYTTERQTENGPAKARRSSIWRLEADGKWRMVFHQGTPTL